MQTIDQINWISNNLIWKEFCNKFFPHPHNQTAMFLEYSSGKTQIVGGRVLNVNQEYMNVITGQYENPLFHSRLYIDDQW